MISASAIEKLRLTTSIEHAPRIWVVGDLMLDIYLTGHVDRISPEAPVPVVRIEHTEERAGGAANVALNVKALGGRVALAGIIGDDEAGNRLQRVIESALHPSSAVLRRQGMRTTVKERAMAGSQQLLRIDREQRISLDSATEDQLIDALEVGLPSPHIIVISDYQKGVVSPSLIARFRARHPDVPIFVDPKGKDFSLYRGVALLKPNEREAQVSSGIEIRDEASCRAAADKLANVVPTAEIVITRGKNGMTMRILDGTFLQSSAPAVRVFDVVGAGDTAIAALAVARGRGLSAEDSLQFANTAAAIAVTKVGAIAVYHAEVLSALSRSEFAIKAIGADGLVELRRTMTALHRRLVFTNGCFDILHVGHLRLLMAARAQGDALIVAINSDASVRRLKGESRPVVSEIDRSTMVAALEAVDYVTIFEEDTPLRTIQSCRPDVLVKGGDYTPATVVGKKEVESWGGRIEIVPLVDGKSTTRIIDEMKK